MAHVMKLTTAAIGHMCRHYERGKDGNGDYIKFGNQNIEIERTHLNYNLAPDRHQGEKIRERCSQVYCLNRKDVNIACSWVVTLPKDYAACNVGRSEKDFFVGVYDFLADRYGKDNVVSAYVHNDEQQPHMHFCFVPVVQDKLKNRLKVSAKECVNKYDLQTFHNDLGEYLEGKCKLCCSILNDTTKEGNKSIQELKRQSATERLREVTEKASKIVSEAQMEAQGIKDSLIAVKAEYEVKKAYVMQADKVSEVSSLYPSTAKITEKGLLNKQKFVTVPVEIWEAKHVSANEKDYLKKANEALEKNLQEFHSTTSSENLAALLQRCNKLEKRNTSLSMENQELRQNLKRAKGEANKILDRVNDVLGKLPAMVVESFVSEWKQNKQQTQDQN